MNSSKPETVIPNRKSNFLTFCAAIFAVMSLPIMGMLWYHRYPVVSFEVITMLTIVLALALLLSAILLFTRALVYNLILVLLITLALLIHFNFLFLGLIGVISLGLLSALAFKERFPILVLFVFISMAFGAWLENRINPSTRLSELSSSTQNLDNGPVIHLLMDGFISPDGLPGREESGSLRENIVSFFEKHGFELHNRAYSHYSTTVDSMTRVFNFQNDDTNLAGISMVLNEPTAFTENMWFNLLDEAGYRINVYQSESMDFCGVSLSKAINCNTFPMPNLRTIHYDLYPALARIPALFNTLISQSSMIGGYLRLVNMLDSWGVSVYDARMLYKLSQDISLQPGGAYFAHVLIPHSPLIYRNDCSIDYSGEPWMRWSASGGEVGNNNETRKLRYGRIVPQVNCALNMLGGFLESLKQKGLYDSATIIVHGDHGTSAHMFSPSVANLQNSYRRDFLEDFSTLFAIKWPNGSFRAYDDVKSLNVLMAETAVRFTGKNAEDLGIAVIREEEPFVYYSDGLQFRQMFLDIFEEANRQGASSQ